MRLSVSLLLLCTSPLAAQSWRTPPAGPDEATPAVGFAADVAVQGNELFAGRTGLESGLPAPPQHQGGVLLFRREGSGGWTEIGTLVGADVALGDGFGSAIAVKGDWLAVGAPTHDGTGAVYLFQRKAAKWVEASRLTAPQAVGGDRFGTAVALDATRLVVGAPEADSARGAIYASRRDPRSGKWTPLQRIGGGTEVFERLGAAVAVAGDRVLAGAPGVQRGGANPFGGGTPPPLRNGSAKVFAVDPRGAWTEEARLESPADTARGFGAAVMLDGIEAYIGAPRTAKAAGAVYVYRRSGSTWQQVARLQPATPEALTGFGSALARAGSSLLVGAALANRQAGRVYVLEKGNDGAWTERQLLAPDTSQHGLMMGARLAADGALAVASAPGSASGLGAVVPLAREADGRWTAQPLVIDKPLEFAAVTGGERKCTKGKAAEFACEQVDLLAFLPISAIGGKRGTTLNDVWGWTDAEGGREYLLVGRSDGTSFLDLTDPSTPRYLGDLPLHAGARANMWRGIRVYKNHAFIVADGAGPHGMQVFDLTQLRDVKGAPVTFTETAHYDRLASAHTLALDEESGFAFAAGANGGGESCGGALHMIDVRDPRHPQFVGCFADVTTGNQRTGYTHETQCVTYKGPDVRYTGHEICFNNSETALGIADVTDKAAPRPLSTATYPNVTYTHQGWLTEDQRYFFVNDEGDEMSGKTSGKTRTLVFDVSKLDEPVLAKEFFGTTAAIDHNLYIRGRYMYQSNYTAGLRVVDVSDPLNPKETAFFDTFPVGDNDTPGFSGTWTNYPFFKSGTIGVTGIAEGIFVLRHRPQEPAVP